MTYHDVPEMGADDHWHPLKVSGLPQRGHRFTADPDWFSVLALAAGHGRLEVQYRWRFEWLEDERRGQSFVEIRLGTSGPAIFAAPFNWSGGPAITARSPRPCKACGNPLPPHDGKGRPPKYHVGDCQRKGAARRVQKSRESRKDE